MSELPGAGAVAGRLEVVVEAALRGFSADLKEGVEKASKGVEAKIKVKVDAKGLRKKLQAKVDEAAKGVEARVKVKADFDAKSLKAKVKLAAEAAETDVKIGTKRKKGFLAGILADAEIARRAARIEADAEVRRGSLVGSFVKEYLRAKAVAALSKIYVPLDVDKKSQRRLGARIGSFLRGGLLVSIVSLIQPLLGAISQLIAGLTAITSAALPALNTLAGFPAVIGTFIQAMLAGKLSMQGFGKALQLLGKQQKGALSDAEAKELKQALAELAPSAVPFAKKLVGLRDEWVKARKVFSEPLFKALDKEIEPLAKNGLPILQKGLKGTTTVLGSFVTGISNFLKDKQNRLDISAILGSNNGLLKSFGKGIGSVAKGMIDFLVASRPFTKRIGQVVESIGQFWENKAARGRRSGSTMEFLDRASERLDLVWRLTKNVVRGFKGIFKAADESVGKKMLIDFERFTRRWAEWTNGEGQVRLQQFFRNTEPGFHELILLIKDASKAFLKMGESPNIQRLVNQIRLELGPALNHLLTTLGETTGPAIVDMITQIVRLLDAMAPITAAFADFIGALAKVIAFLVKLIDLAGPLGDATLAVLGYAAAWRVLTKLPLIGGLINGIKLLIAESLGINGATAAMTRFQRAAMLAKGAAGIGTAYLGESIGNKLENGIGGRKGAAANALSTIAGYTAGGALIGSAVPIPGIGTLSGAAIGATIGSIKALTDARSKSAQAEKDAEQRQKDLAAATLAGRDALRQQFEALNDYVGALRASNGKIDQSVRERALETVKNAVTIGDKDKGIKASKPGDLVDAANSVGLNRSDLVSGVLGDPAAIKRISDAYSVALKTGKAFLSLRGSGEMVNVADQLKMFFATENKDGAAMPGLIEEFSRDVDEAKAENAALIPLAKKLTGLREEVRKAVIAKVNSNAKSGKIFDGTQLAQLQKQFSLNPASVQKIAKSLALSPDQYQQIMAQYRNIKNAKQAAANPPKAAPQGKGLGPLLPAPGSTLATLLKGAVKRPTIQAPKFDPKPAQVGISALLKSINALPSRIGAARGPVKTASTGVADSAKAPLKGLPASMNTYGNQSASGFVSGLAASQWLSRSAAAAAALVQAAKNAVVAEAEIHSPSKMMKRLGAYMSEGFAKGIMGGEYQVKQAIYRLLRLVTKAKGNSEAKRLKKQFEDEFKVMIAYGKKRSKLQQRLNRAQEKLDDLRSRKQSLIDTVKQSGDDYGSVSGIADTNGGFLSPGFLVRELQRRLKDTKSFAYTLNMLRKRGFGEATIRQIAEQGIEGGLKLGRQLLKASPKEVRQIKYLQGQISRISNKAGVQTANGLYNAGINAAKGLIKGLKSQMKELDKIAGHMAHVIVKAIKRELHIKSPSRVTMLLGKFTTQGLGKGMLSEKAVLLKKATRLSQDLAHALTPSIPEVPLSNLSASQLAAARSSAHLQHREAAAEAKTSGPLVENLHLTAGTPADAREVLDEAVFALHRINNGGVYADRTA